MHASSLVAGCSSSSGPVLDGARGVPSTLAPPARVICRADWSSSRGICDDSIFSLFFCGVCGLSVCLYCSSVCDLRCLPGHLVAADQRRRRLLILHYRHVNRGRFLCYFLYFCSTGFTDYYLLLLALFIFVCDYMDMPFFYRFTCLCSTSFIGRVCAYA